MTQELVVFQSWHQAWTSTHAYMINRNFATDSELYDTELAVSMGFTRLWNMLLVTSASTAGFIISLNPHE